MYVYCVGCYCVVVAPYVRSVAHVYAYLYTLDDDSECPMDYETSLLSKVFPFRMDVIIFFPWKERYVCMSDSVHVNSMLHNLLTERLRLDKK